LPVAYAEQLLGVLYVEKAENHEFAESEQLLLETIADLLAGALHNATALQKAQEQAITDDVTGVKTHRYLMEAFSSECKRAARANRSFTVAMMDLDHFKFINDFYGHLEGDALLRRIGQLLEQHCRRSDVVARYGGDEFVLLMPETGIEQACQHTQKLRAKLAADPVLREKNATVSFGIAAFPVHGSTPDHLLQLADASMYLSKHRGGNAITTAEQFGIGETQKWKRNVLEAYLNVTLKRKFSTGPEVFEEIFRRFEQFARSPVGQEEPFVAGEPLPVLLDSLISLAFALDARDQHTRGHSQKVSAYAVMVAQVLKFSAPEVEEIRVAGLLHDVGKVGIAEAIVSKPEPLDTQEWENIRMHPTLGARLLEPLSNVRHIQEIIRHHHEFFDGSGYPAGLLGERIPRGALLLSIAEAYDTLTCGRAYRKALTPEETFAELERCADTQFHPELVHAFIETMRQLPRPFIEIGLP
jgi:diguanylate cyclase (GGDEF)-like protein/putative nucleotidyltransferase with HDIG domain